MKYPFSIKYLAFLVISHWLIHTKRCVINRFHSCKIASCKHSKSLCYPIQQALFYNCPSYIANIVFRSIYNTLQNDYDFWTSVLNIFNKSVNIYLLQLGVGGSDALVSAIRHQAPADHVPYQIIAIKNNNPNEWMILPLPNPLSIIASISLIHLTSW